MHRTNDIKQYFISDVSNDKKVHRSKSHLNKVACFSFMFKTYSELDKTQRYNIFKLRNEIETIRM